jgi:hypothetical protein
MGKKSRKGKKAGHQAQAAAPQDAGAGRTSAKREAVVSGGRKDSRSTLIGLGVAAAVVGLVAFFIFGGGSSGFTAVRAEAGMVRIPVAEVNDGYAHYYTYDDRGRDVNFFVLRSSDGVIRAAFDACDVCFQEKKGYRQEGDIMVCNNCGQRFPSVQINVLKGGCNPAPLDRAVQGDYLVMKASDIQQGGYYF